MEDLAGWIAPIATTVAAVMTAANLGTRVTGWGFVVFTIGSVAWVTIALGTGQSNLLWANGFLTIVNVIGIWRWLGRQARHEDGRKTATARSAAERVPTLFGLGAVVGATVTGRDDATIGTVIDGMMQCDGARLAYVVVGEGGVGGVGERLHAVSPKRLRFSADGVSCDLSAEELASEPVLEPGAWPAALDRADVHAEA